jgi:hypothetical protein
MELIAALRRFRLPGNLRVAQIPLQRLHTIIEISQQFKGVLSSLRGGRRGAEAAGDDGPVLNQPQHKIGIDALHRRSADDEGEFRARRGTGIQRAADIEFPDACTIDYDDNKVRDTGKGGFPCKHLWSRVDNAQVRVLPLDRFDHRIAPRRAALPAVRSSWAGPYVWRRRRADRL